MRVSVPKEVLDGERRVATTPDVVKQIQKLGFDVEVESGAGEAANFSDAAYQAAGASIASDAANCFKNGDIILKVNKPTEAEEELLQEGQTLISFFWPAQNEDLLARLSEKQVNVIAMDAVPRISRAQKMDALSSMANIAGYRAVVEASNHFGRFFTGQITAAGKMPPAKVMIIGAGVAGLAAIASGFQASPG